MKARFVILFTLIFAGTGAGPVSAPLPAPVSCTAPSFAPEQEYGVGNYPWSVVVGDFNADDRPDLATANDDATASVLLGNGDGSFQPAVAYALADDALGIAVGDFNGDSRLDLAAASYGDAPNYDGTVSVLMGNGDGSFQAATFYPAGSRSWSVGVGDFDADGRPDLAVANVNSNDISVLLGNGDGSFQPQVRYATRSAPDSVVVGDFDRDGWLDLATANDGSSVSILLGNGDGSFQAAVNYSAGTNPHDVAVGDFNADGRLDLAVANNYFIFDNGGVSILLGNGDGSFQAAVVYDVGYYPNSVAVSDLNGDGRQDVAGATAYGESILLGNGDGTFQATVDFEIGMDSTSVAVSDLDHDGRPDLAVTVAVEDRVSILPNTCATLHVAAIAPGYRPLGDEYRVDTRITVQDETFAPASGAAVLMDATLPDGTIISGLIRTNHAGSGGFWFLSPQTGRYQFCVRTVRKPGWAYDPSRNIETCDRVMIPSNR